MNKLHQKHVKSMVPEYIGSQLTQYGLAPAKEEVSAAKIVRGDVHEQ